MIVRKLRLKRGWSQEQLAEMSGLSVRTIQRIERGQGPGLESSKSLAAVFEVPVTALRQEDDIMTEAKTPTRISSEEERIIEYVRDLKGFYTHLTSYVLVMLALFVINLVFTPGYIWAFWAALGWGIGILVHGLNVFELINWFGPDWERRQVEKRLGRKL
ncbi:MAG: 2TM domain-containing protein [Gammaproteobacteria bacterium]|nr:2TM domain-containing protein [Gammaproteobacteria bacterium]MDE0281659.1 2TM domain-containing protein [Gammaproteobacteria bacterium]MDE0716256.1 2TM domain-containing protein [Gammaproteobacteria bacterium]MXY65278.1 helix-turn-helix domain-containing protein [Gammaproteobacteria bacterium]MYG66179.1 helix-turn-helix domain-containing protein [Gammaproteobacteria bacterium]